MSANRSVQAAQRRRAGGPEPAAPGRGPQPSINSSQMFSGQGQQQMQQQQMRPGTTGRLAGQQAQQQQMQQQQMQQQQMQGGNNEGLAGISKMTLAQAITLITLRLGKVETQMHHMHHESFNNNGASFASGEGAEGMENMVLVDKTLMDSIMSRLESLEKRSPSAATSSGSSADITLLKQQFDAIKPSIAQNTKTATALTKEQKDHKQQMDVLKNELSETKTLLNALQTLSVDNSQKIFQLMSGEVVNGDEVNEFTDVNNDEDAEEEDVDGESEELDITGANLKGLIEQELNA